ncbi:MAG TPA: hypothetical protein VMA72_13160 [Streptosporangiaceae bacterium]|nr:hypothetical protein [Streptosporangiaceae bacterium]
MAGWRGRSSLDSRRRVSRPVGCLLWLVVLLVILILAAVLFGGFQKGTKATGSPQSPVPAAISAFATAAAT